VENDITGAVLLDLQFQDLRELGVQSFGKRHQIWNHIISLREHFDESNTSTSQNENSRPPHRRSNTTASNETCSEVASTPVKGKRRRRKHRKNGYEPVTPADSVSIVAIEQVFPEPHICHRGDNCEKARQQKRLFKRLEQQHGFPISPSNGGRIFMVGNPGNPRTAKNLIENIRKIPTERSSVAVPKPEMRPTSEAETSVVGPSVVASSDILGPGQMPDFTLDPEKLNLIEERDPQDNVKMFLALQSVEPPQPLPSIEVEPPPQPPPQESPNHPQLQPPPDTPGPLANLQSLPRLQIPQDIVPFPSRTSFSAGPTGYEDMFSPYSCRTAIPSPAGANLFRFATPASDMDVPVTQPPVGPVSREASQSVPPNMHFNDPVQRASSRPMDWRRPQTQLAPLAEDTIYQPADEHPNSSSSNTHRTSSPSSSSTRSSASDTTGLNTATNADSSQTTLSEYYDPRYPGITHSGWMKKRKTRLLRHEWHEHHFRLTDNAQLTMHRNDMAASSALDTLNIDDYNVACSSLASNKLSAKLKALKIQSNNRNSLIPGKDEAFSFQLVPARNEGEPGKVRKITDSRKTHHFAVKSRDERIDWMRELMLAKAMREKESKGYEVEVVKGGKEADLASS
jgi:guanine nucleotide exchange factor for Rho/Rac/Cdc42-like GTPase family protein/SAM (Sterile alpha motif) domain-containing protein